MRAILAVLVLASISVTSRAADEAIEIGGMSLRIGMPEKSILEKLGPYFGITCPAEKFKSCMVMNKDGPPYSPVANLVFENGKLTRVLRYWSGGYEGTDPSRLVETLYAALSTVAGNGPVTVRIALGERREPGVVAKTIFISRGRKTISISVTEGLKSQGKAIPTFTNVDEVIE